MATGGDFGYDDPVLDDAIDNDDNNDDQESIIVPSEDEQEVNRTEPFEPTMASTPYNGGEQIEMHTMQHEQSGLPDTSFEETPFLRRAGSISDLQNESLLRQKMKKAVDMIKAKFPKVNFEIIKVRRGKGKNEGKIVAIGPKGEEYKILKDDESDLAKNFLDGFKKRLEPRAEEIIAQDRDTIREQRQRLTEAEDQERRVNALAAEKEKEEQEMKNLRQQVGTTQARIDSLQEGQCSNFEIEAEINRLKQLKKNYQKDLDSKKKKVASLEKEAKNKEKN